MVHRSELCARFLVKNHEMIREREKAGVNSVVRNRERRADPIM